MSEPLGDLQDRTFARATAATAGSYPAQRRLSAAQLASYLDRRAFAVVASTRADGRPHAAMSAYVRRDATFWLPTVTGSVRERNVRAHPWLSLTVTEGDRDQHVVVLIEGPAAIVSPGEVPADVRAAVTGDWIGCWLRLDAASVRSYAAPAAAAVAGPAGPG
jgi:predicted pyridoxine 5'-phosphate oxidase superfamily flavin-nucleotide-binding protein